MMQTILATVLLAFAPLTPARTFYILMVAQSGCPAQVFVDIASCPVTLDVTKIAVDPYTNKPCLLAWKLVPEATQWTYSGKYCDPDSDPMTIAGSVAGNFLSRLDGTYSFTDVAGPAGTIVYPTVTLTDKPAAGDAITRKGTIAIISVPKNSPPSLY